MISSGMRSLDFEAARKAWIETDPAAVAVLEGIVAALPERGERCPECGTDSRDGGGYVRVGTPDFGGGLAYDDRGLPRLSRRVLPCPTCNKPDLLREAGIPAEYAGWGLDTYRGDRGALAAVRAWAATPEGSLLLSGGTGRGKTGLAVGAARALCEAGRAARFTTVAHLLDRIREGFDRGTAAAIEAAYVDADVLVLDDLAAARPTEWARERIPALIDARLSAGRPTLVTLDKGAEWIIDNYDERLASRFRLYRAVKVGGADMRGAR